MKEKKMVPKIRFPGFTEPWEQRKLGEIADYRRGSFPQPYGKTEWYGGKDAMPFIQVIDVMDELKLVPTTKQTISKLAQPHSVFVKEGSVLVTLQGSIGRVAITQYPAYIDRTLLVFVKYRFPIDNYFWATEIKRKFQVEAVKAPGGTIKTITKEALSDFMILMPKIEEQIQIGNFFKSYDRLVTLHQRKLDDLKELKKFLLQKMFPRNGEAFPEIRFPGFTDPWEQRKLGDLFNEYSIKNHSELPALTIVQGYGTVKRDSMTRNLVYDKENLKGYKVVQKDDFIVHLRSFEGGLEKANSIGIVSPAYHIFKGNEIDPRFYYAFFRFQYFINHLLKPCVYGIRDGRSISIPEMIDILIPWTSVLEQTQIGNLISEFDELLTLHQRKLDDLKELKKGLLQQMFV